MNSAFNASANLVAVIHLAYFFFVLGGAVAIAAGGIKRWRWVSNPWFRITHSAAVFIVLFEEITGVPCVLNLAQAWLRTKSIGQEQATEGMGGLLDFLLYETISPLSLDIFYWSMGVIVLLLFWKVPMQRRHAGSIDSSEPVAGSTD